MERQDLERLTREQLIAQAERLEVPRPRVLTQPELIDEIITRTTKGAREREKQRGWLGRARDLLARVVERGLHLPEAARVLRTSPDERSWPTPRPPLPTVTLAEIYAAQGHLERAITVLDEVIAREPDHREARALRARFAEQVNKTRARSPNVGAASGPHTPGPAEPAQKQDATLQTQEIQREEEAKEAVARAPDTDPPEAIATTLRAPVIAPSDEPAAPRATHETPSKTVEFASPEPAVEILSTADVAASDEAASPLEDAPLPERYDVDEIVAIAVDPRTVYLYWEIRATTLAHAQAKQPDGWLDVRVASVTASWDGPLVETLDLRVDALYGDRFVRDIRPGSNVRVSVGWKTDTTFEPFAVGVEVTAPRAVPVEPVADEIARWQPDSGALAPARSRRAAMGAAQPMHAPFLFPGAAPEADPEFVAHALFVSRAPAYAAGRPADTGVEVWRGNGDAPRSIEGFLLPIEGAWYTPGGASHLVRGGASDLTRGGASDLARIAGA